MSKTLQYCYVEFRVKDSMVAPTPLIRLPRLRPLALKGHNRGHNTQHNGHMGQKNVKLEK